MYSMVNSLQPLADKLAIGLSSLCALHCLAVPTLLVLSPSMMSIGLQNEDFHTWIVIVVIPVSILAITVGCRAHRHKSVLWLGLLGLTSLCLTAAFGPTMLGETGEKLATLLGAIIIAVSHLKNYTLCRQGNACECH